MGNAHIGVRIWSFIHSFIHTNTRYTLTWLVSVEMFHTPLFQFVTILHPCLPAQLALMAKSSTGKIFFKIP
jgi:ABC-type siderophore export system fused ATPase/permease subunit